MGLLKPGRGSAGNQPADALTLARAGDLPQSAFGFLPVPLQTVQIGGRAIFSPNFIGLISTN